MLTGSETRLANVHGTLGLGNLRLEKLLENVLRRVLNAWLVMRLRMVAEDGAPLCGTVYRLNSGAQQRGSLSGLHPAG